MSITAIGKECAEDAEADENTASSAGDDDDDDDDVHTEDTENDRLRNLEEDL